jgi:hypothetical protein
VEWYREYFSDTGRSTALWALLGFFVTFTITRGITRRIRAKNAGPPAAAGGSDGGSDQASDGGGFSDIYIGGVHVHHQVWGILLVLLAGLLQFRYSPEAPWSEMLAVMFGAGAALTLDEFALWFHLDDVYWGPDGRKSVDAIMLGGALGVVLLMQANPFAPANDLYDLYTIGGYLLGVAFHLTMAVVCFLKSKLATGLIGIMVPLVAFVGAVRLAKPDSVWARRRYGARKVLRSKRRFGDAYQRRWDRVRDVVGGALHPSPATPGAGSSSGGDGPAG